MEGTLGKRTERGFQRETQKGHRRPTFDPSTIVLRSGMTKAESSILMQARTEKIGLRAFLFTRKVPEITTPYCECGGGRERLVHVALHCPRERDRFAELFPDIRNSKDLRDALSSPKEAKAMAQWILSTGSWGCTGCIAKSLRRTSQGTRSSQQPNRRRLRRERRTSQINRVVEALPVTFWRK